MGPLNIPIRWTKGDWAKIGLVVRLNIYFISCTDGYFVAYKSIILPSILFMLIEMKFIHCHSCVMFAMKVNEYVQ